MDVCVWEKRSCVCERKRLVCVLETATWCLEIAARRLALLFAFPSFDLTS